MAEKYYRLRSVDLLYKWHSGYERWLLEQAGIEQPEAGADKIKPYVVAV